MLALCFPGAFAPLHERAGIAMELWMPRALATASPSEISALKRAPSLRKASGGAVMQQRERADRIGRSVENELGPLRARASCSE